MISDDVQDPTTPAPDAPDQPETTNETTVQSSSPETTPNEPDAPAVASSDQSPVAAEEPAAKQDASGSESGSQTAAVADGTDGPAVTDSAAVEGTPDEATEKVLIDPASGEVPAEQLERGVEGGEAPEEVPPIVEEVERTVLHLVWAEARKIANSIHQWGVNNGVEVIQDDYDKFFKLVHPGTEDTIELPGFIKNLVKQEETPAS